MRARPLAAILCGCLTALFLHLACPMTASAQAWLPPEGDGQVTFSYQNIYVRYHVDSTGKKLDLGAIRAHTKVISFEYGLTKRLALDADINYVSAKYLGRVPHGPPDTGSYHPTFQDLRIGVRYNAYNGPVVVTPFVGVVIPTHHYDARGHSAVGRDLRELQMGVNVGRDLEGLIPRSYVHGRYSFAIVQRVEEFNLNRSNADWEIGHVATRRLALRFTGIWQRTHGGIDVPQDREHPHFEDIHDRATRSNFIRLGGGASFSISKSLDLHADYTRTISGINTHLSRGFSLGMSWRFSRGFNIGQSAAVNAPGNAPGRPSGLGPGL